MSRTAAPAAAPDGGSGDVSDGGSGDVSDGGSGGAPAGGSDGAPDGDSSDVSDGAAGGVSDDDSAGPRGCVTGDATGVSESVSTGEEERFTLLVESFVPGPEIALEGMLAGVEGSTCSRSSTSRTRSTDPSSRRRST